MFDGHLNMFQLLVIMQNIQLFLDMKQIPTR